ncbi:alpha-galactosidase [Actinomycetaceae bacterium WB03_NA08]|uniref:Alpha-galactosidase n=2 Tax=Scrofimicrobium canadense TaxID=2652290 RepID=A0A6N7W877_9ACTO|nr:alpha-galactosidase [Scrofimicrobium canadense]
MGKDALARTIHARAGGLSLVLDTSSQRIPRIVYWGAELTGETSVTLEALVCASREPLAGNAPDLPAATGIVPLESDGWLGRAGLKGFRSGGVDWSPRFDLVSVETPETDGVKSDGVLECGAGKLIFGLTDERAHLDLRIEVELFPQGLFRTRCRLGNSGDGVYHLQELGIALPLPLTANEVLDMTGRWGKERHPQRQDVQVACRLRESWRGRTGFDAPDMTMVGEKGFSFQSGNIWGLHTAFSGNHRTWVQKLPSGEEIIGGSEALYPGEVSLETGAEYATPYFYALHAVGLDDAANRVQSWMRSRNNHVKTPRPVTINVWEAVYFRHDLPELLALADKAASIGVERYVLDDGWFRGRRDDHQGLGDWYVDEEVWPQGLGPLADYVHSKGMQFGLWFEPEMVSMNSDLARSHPDWVMGARGTDSESLPLEWRHQQVLNISIPEARKYLEDRIVSLVKEYGIDYIKWDHNRDLIDAGNLQQEGRAAVHLQTLSTYKLLDDIRSQCPGLEIESCSSGGGRIDLEILQHTDRVWVSDCIDPVERQEMTRWLAQLLPPELMGTHVASPHSHTTGRWSTMSMRGATALWGHFGIEWDISSADPEEIEELRQWISFYKQQRAFLHSGSLVRCETPDDSLWLQGIVAPDKDRALFQLVTRHRPSISPWGRITFAGLDDKKTYQIRPILIGAAPSGLQMVDWFGAEENFYVSTNQGVIPVDTDLPGITLTGAALRHVGVQTPLMHPDQALLIEISSEN